MKHNIIPSLEHLAYPIDKLTFLPGNPQQSDIQAIKAVLREFGQHNCVLANGDPEKGGVVLAGNHRTLAAKEEGWTHVAVAWVTDDEVRAKARAVADNRVSELGHMDEALLADFLPEVIENYFELFEVLEIDDFTLAAMQEAVSSETVNERGYVAPTVVDRPDKGLDRPDPESKVPQVTNRTDEDLVTTGAGDTDNKRNAIVQYTLVFDSPEQQRRWHQFIAWLRNDPGTDGETTAERLLYFLDTVADF